MGVRQRARMKPGGDEPRLVALLGGTIGNFPPGTRRRMLRKIGALLGPGDRLLLGTDLVKDPAVLVAAYDDAAGLTAEFNKNILRVLNATHWVIEGNRGAALKLGLKPATLRHRMKKLGISRAVNAGAQISGSEAG